MATETVDERDRRSIGVREWVRLVAVAVLVVVIVGFAFDNSQDVEVGWVFGEGDLALWVVILGSFLAGGLVGYLVARHRRG
jgi:uncharacterized integral membrane protein